MNNAKKLLLIINPQAGRMRANTSLFSIVSQLSAGGYETTIYLTKEQGDATRKAESEGSDYDTMVCAGGDGTLNEVINGVMKLKNKPPLGYLPCGSTNDFANTLGIPLILSKAAKSIARGAPYALDLGCFNGRYFSYVASFGMFTAIAYETKQQYKNQLGHLAYLLDAPSALSKIKPYTIRCTGEDFVDEGDYIFGAVTNSTSIAGVYKLPEDIVELNDGIFEVFLLKYPKTPVELNDLLWALSLKDFNNEDIVLHRASEVTIESYENLPFTLDGEFGGDPRKAVIKNEKQAIRFLLDKKTEHMKLLQK